MHHRDSHMVIHRSLVITLVALVSLAVSACAGPIGWAYTATSAGSMAVTGKTPTEHSASYVTDADCSIFNIFNNEYICEYNRNPALTYNRNPL
jgi:uncharacterized membrane protein